MLRNILKFLGFKKAEKLSTFSREHQNAHNYWKNCSNSFLASQEYYEKCEKTLQEIIIPQVGTPKFLLDVGCGNGRLTSILAGVSQHVDAFDISPQLIEQAKNNALTESIENITYKVSDIVFEEIPEGPYDIASCMGVISTIIDDWALERLLTKITKSLANGGYLVLRDTLSTTNEGKLIDDKDYTTHYRSQSDYKKTFEKYGYKTILEIPLVKSTDYINAFFLLKLER